MGCLVGCHNAHQLHWINRALNALATRYSIHLPLVLSSGAKGTDIHHDKASSPTPRLMVSVFLVSLTLLIAPMRTQDAAVPRLLNPNPALPEVLHSEFTLHQKQAKQALLDAIDLYSSGRTPRNWDRRPFDDVLIALPLHPSVVHTTDGKGGSDKFYVGPNVIRQRGREFIVYGAGIANDPYFEVEIAKLNASVFGFDCTVWFDYTLPGPF